MVVDKDLIEIISMCLALDAKAVKIYSDLSRAADNPDLSAFWDNMSSEEQDHCDSWRYLLSLAKKDMLPQVFSDPEKIMKELQQIQNKIEGLLNSHKNLSDVSTSFLIAYRIEFYMLHPAFPILFHFVQSLDDKKKPEDEYEFHISKFVEALIKFGTVTPELDLLGESLQRLWKENRALSMQSFVDELTGVLNRRGFNNIVKPLSYLAQRNNNTVGIVMADIDHFKNINDSYGHQQGDRVLRRVANILKNSIRLSDIIGRYGGEEFIIYMSSVEPGAIFEVVDKIRKTVESDAMEGIKVTASFGVACGVFNDSIDEELQSFISQADACMYKAKESGRNRVVVSSLQTA